MDEDSGLFDYKPIMACRNRIIESPNGDMRLYELDGTRYNGSLTRKTVKGLRYIVSGDGRWFDGGGKACEDPNADEGSD